MKLDADKIPVTVEIFIAMNEDGGYVVSKDESDVLELLTENEGGWRARVVKLNVKMTPPQLDEVNVVVPDEAGKVEAQPAE